jgi:hypothetical protein
MHVEPKLARQNIPIFREAMDAVHVCTLASFLLINDEIVTINSVTGLAGDQTRVHLVEHVRSWAYWWSACVVLGKFGIDQESFKVGFEASPTFGQIVAVFSD